MTTKFHLRIILFYHRSFFPFLCFELQNRHLNLYVKVEKVLEKGEAFFSFIIIFFSHYSWFTMFCQFSTGQQVHPVTYMYTLTVMNRDLPDTVFVIPRNLRNTLVNVFGSSPSSFCIVTFSLLPV